AHWQNYKKKYPKVNFKEFLQKETPVKSLLADDFRFQMGKVKDEKLYKIYNKIAETLHIPDIPPFMPEDSSKYKPGGMEGHNGNIDNKLENPISDVHYPFILENPETGEKVDTRLEFPMETPKTWEDYLLLKKDSQILGKNMEKAGQVRPAHSAGHHIIPITMKDSQPAIKEMRFFGVNGNDAENGVYLPQAGVDSNGNPSPAVGLIHSGVHPRVYAIAVNDRILALNLDKNDIPAGKQKIINELNNIKQELIDAPKNGKTWYNAIK
ncbi:hypothetical protein GK256_25705, partial [Salmonella enterica]|nr:hypothetical protein [Salmonella enterica]